MPQSLPTVAVDPTPLTRRLALALVLAVLATLTLVSAPVDHARAAAADIYTMLNQYRVAHGKPALVRLPALDSVAQNWSNSMASTRVLAHNPSYDRQVPGGWSWVGENVGYGYSDKQIHDALVASSGHRANMLRSEANAVGIGYATNPDGRIWITQNFASYPNVSAYLTPTDADRKVVRAFYLDMLGREPDAAGAGFWSTTMVRQGRGAVAWGFANSREYRRLTIAAAYRNVLGRDASGTDLDFWEQQVAAGRTTLDNVPIDLFNSPEFYARSGGTNDAFVRRMYQLSLGRQPGTQAEIDYWSGRIARDGRWTAVAGIYTSYESALVRVDRSYQRFLGRTAGSGERAAWAGTVQRYGDEHMRLAVQLSDEYYLRAQNR